MKGWPLIEMTSRLTVDANNDNDLSTPAIRLLFDHIRRENDKREAWERVQAIQVSHSAT